MNMSTPAQAGFYMPAEWLPHERCWMSWPCNKALWGDGMNAAREAYASVARSIALFEPVTMVVNARHCADAEKLCGADVEVLPLPVNDSWMRDTGPTFIRDARGRVAAVDWQFNNYGNKHQEPQAAYLDDTLLTERILSHLTVQRFAAPLVLEGGSIHVDGEGTLLTSEQCLLNANRNPQLSRDEIEARLKDFLGVSHIIWLGKGLQDDDTDGHVDNLACFVRPGVVMALTCHDSTDANYALLQNNLERLHAGRDAVGRSLEVIEIEQPAMRMHAGVRLAMSYINFYLANGAVIMPAFDQPEYDDAAARAVSKAFPDREVVQLPGGEIIKGGGNVHCITQQQPCR